MVGLLAYMTLLFRMSLKCSVICKGNDLGIAHGDYVLTYMVQTSRVTVLEALASLME
jgi:hypothetical protein